MIAMFTEYVVIQMLHVRQTSHPVEISRGRLQWLLVVATLYAYLLLSICCGVSPSLLPLTIIRNAFHKNMFPTNRYNAIKSADRVSPLCKRRQAVRIISHFSFIIIDELEPFTRKEDSAA